ncbi:MAG: glycosyltransferase family 2 protein [Polyangiales bacterium]
MSVHVIIVNYRVADLAMACLRSLVEERARVPGLRATVVENDSGDEAALRAGLRDATFDGWVDLIVAERNGGFSYGNNHVMRRLLEGSDAAEYVLLLNPDTQIRPGAVETLVAFMEANPKVGLAGAGLENEDGSEWPIAFRFPGVLSEFESGASFGPISKLLRKYAVAQTMGDAAQPVDWVPGAAMIVRRQVLHDAGLMDERYFLYFEETDFCLAARRAGWPCWYVPDARVMHIAGQSTGVTVRNQRPARLPGYWFESRRHYFVKNHGQFYAWMADMAFLSGLTLYHAKRTLQRREDDGPPQLFRDFLHHSAILTGDRPKQADVTSDRQSR